jgi:hypothetical protein
MASEGAATSSNLGRAGAVDEGNDQIAQGSEHLGRVACTQPRTIVAEGDVADVVQAVLNAPVPADEREQSLGAGVGGGERGDEIAGLLAARALGRGGGDHASEVGDLGDVEPGRCRAWAMSSQGEWAAR